MTMKKTLAAVTVAAATLAGPALADDIDTVRAFYSDILTDPAGTTADRYFELFSPDVVSIPTPPGARVPKACSTRWHSLARSFPT
jgi:hypothetical protein